MPRGKPLILDLRSGAMMRAVWLASHDSGDVLLLTVHHLAMDVVSWHIVLGYLADAWTAVRSGTAPKAPMEFTSYRQWSQLMHQRVQPRCAAPAWLLGRTGFGC